jgi:hypothetical protein
MDKLFPIFSDGWGKFALKEFVFAIKHGKFDTFGVLTSFSTNYHGSGVPDRGAVLVNRASNVSKHDQKQSCKKYVRHVASVIVDKMTARDGAVSIITKIITRS